MLNFIVSNGTDEEYEIPYEIPVEGGACKQVTHSSLLSWRNFRHRVLSEMDVSFEDMHHTKLGYKISTEAVRQPIHCLDNLDEYKKMLENATDLLRNATKGKKKKGKAVYVCIHNRTAAAQKSHEKSKVRSCGNRWIRNRG